MLQEPAKPWSEFFGAVVSAVALGAGPVYLFRHRLVSMNRLEYISLLCNRMSAVQRNGRFACNMHASLLCAYLPVPLLFGCNAAAMA